jgi:hypothetical protein
MAADKLIAKVIKLSCTPAMPTELKTQAENYPRPKQS